jgi:hypothetical protein
MRGKVWRLDVGDVESEAERPSYKYISEHDTSGVIESRTHKPFETCRPSASSRTPSSREDWSWF